MKKNKIGCVYFITDGDAIKIGFAKKLTTRLQGLQSCHYCHLYILGAISGSMEDERALQKRFHHLRLKGEWFRVAPEITRTIDDFEDAGLFICGEEIEEWNSIFPKFEQPENQVTDYS